MDGDSLVDLAVSYSAGKIHLCLRLLFVSCPPCFACLLRLAEMNMCVSPVGFEGNLSLLQTLWDLLGLFS